MRVGIILSACILLGPGGSLRPEALRGQEGSFAFQIKGGVSTPLGAFKDTERGWEGGARKGASFGMGFTVPLHKALKGYLGFDQHRFACDEEVCPKGKNWESTGFDIALRAVVGRERIRPWFQGGIHTHRIETRLLEPKGVRRQTSEGGVGFEFGGGVLIQVGERMSLIPGVRYGEGTVPFTTKPDLDLRYWVVDVGLVMGF